MKGCRVIILIFIILGNMFFTSGCWNYKEINKMAIVAGCTIDRGENGKKYLMTVEIVNPKPSGTETKIVSEIFQNQGDSLFEIVRGLGLRTGRKLYWSHAKVVILSKDIAREGLTPVIDWLLRDSETRSEMWILISKEKTARELLETDKKINAIESFHLDDAMRTRSSSSKFISIDIFDAARELMAEGVQVVLPAVSSDIEGGKKSSTLSGTAIFKKGKFVGFINEYETRSMVWIRGEVRGGIYEVKNALETNSTIILEIFDSHTKVYTYLKGGKPAFTVNVRADVDIAEVPGTINVFDKDGLEKLRNQAENQIKNDLENTVKKAQNQYQSDIFRFGDLVHRKMPKLWEGIKSNWSQVFSEADVSINVHLDIVGSAKLSKPLKVGD